MTATPAYPGQALARLTEEVDRLSGKIDRLGEMMATKADLARYAPRETVEARWEEFERRVSEIGSRVEVHDSQLSGLMRDAMTREMRWDWRVIGGMGCALTFLVSFLGSIATGTIVGVAVWFVTHH